MTTVRLGEENVTFPSMRFVVEWGAGKVIDEFANIRSLDIPRGAWPQMNNMRHTSASLYGTVKFQNAEFRYSPGRAGGGIDAELYPSLLSMPPEGFGVEVYVGFAPDQSSPVEEEYLWFTGRLIQPEYSETGAIASFRVVDKLWLQLQNKLSSQVFEDNDVHELLLNYGMSLVDACPIQFSFAWLNNDSVISDAFDIASVSLGAVYPDEHGVISFHNYGGWYQNTDVAGAFTPDDNYRNLESRPERSFQATEVRVPYTPRVRGNPQVLYTLDEPLTIPPGETKVFLFETAYPVYGQTAETWRVTAGIGPDMSTDVTVGFEYKGQEITCTITNSNSVLTAYLVHLSVVAESVRGLPSRNLKEPANVTPKVKRSVSAGNSFYIQNIYHATWLAKVLADRNAYEVAAAPQWRTITGVPVAPWLKIGDRVTYQIVKGVSPTDAFIYWMRLSYNEGGGITQTFHVVNSDYLYPLNNYYMVGDTLNNFEVASY